jgi:predicted Fe-Mo cluster-binding NifX family protein
LKAEPGNEHKNNNEKMRTIKLTNSRDLHNLIPIALYYTLRGTTKMKICVSATANNLEAQLDPRFGRCLYLVIVDSETMQFEAIPNMASGATGGAGIQAAQTTANNGVKVVITGNVGPNAFGALSAAGIEIVTGAFGTVREVVEKFKRGELQRAGAPTVGGHFRMGRGRGRGAWIP